MLCSCTVPVLITMLTACGSSSDGSPGPSDDEPGQAMISRNNYADLLAHVFEIYTGDYYNQPLLAVGDFTIEGRNPDGSFIDVHNCETGGYEQLLDPSSTLTGLYYEFVFDDCLENDTVYDGAISGRNSGYGESIESATGFSFQVHPELVTTFSGKGVFNTTMSRSDLLHQWQSTGVTLDSRTIDGNLSLGMMDTTFGYGMAADGAYRAWLSGGFTVRSDTTNGNSLTVSNPVPMSYECDPGAEPPCDLSLAGPWSFTTGQLELVAEDGSSLLLEADTPTQESVSISISNDSGVDTFEAEWSTWQGILSFRRFPQESPDWVSAQSLATGELEATPAIRPDNYTSLLDYLFETMTGATALQALDSVQAFLGSTEAQSTSIDQGVRTELFNCNPDGTAMVWRVDNDTSKFPLDYRIDFLQCDINQHQVEGSIRGQEIRTASGAIGLATSGLQWLDGSGMDWEFSGESAIERSTVDGEIVCTWETDLMNLYANAGTGNEMVVTGSLHFETRESDNSGVALTLSGSFSVTSESTDGYEFAVGVSDLKTPGTKEVPPGEWNFNEGSLTVLAYDRSWRWSGDNSRLILDAENSNIDIHNSEAIYDINSPWESWRDQFAEAHARLCSQTSDADKQ